MLCTPKDIDVWGCHRLFSVSLNRRIIVLCTYYDTSSVLYECVWEERQRILNDLRCLMSAIVHCALSVLRLLQFRKTNIYFNDSDLQEDTMKPHNIKILFLIFLLT